MTRCRSLGVFAVCWSLASCARTDPSEEAREFLRMYNSVDQHLYQASAEAAWRAATDVTSYNVGHRAGTNSALASFRGSRYVIESARRHLGLRQSLGDIEFRQLDKILLNAAEWPGTKPDVVKRRAELEARIEGVLNGFSYCLGRAEPRCAQPVDANAIDEVLRDSRQLPERLRYWEASKKSGIPLKQGLAEVRDLRNSVAKELGYSSYFHLQVADYGLTVDELLRLTDRVLADIEPLYTELRRYASRTLAARYKRPVPDLIPAHWLGNRWGQAWPGLVKSADFDALFRGKKPEWVIQQAEDLYKSIGMPPLPATFWTRSDLYPVLPGSNRRKSQQPSVWQIDRNQDVRSLMNVSNNFYWWKTAHHELGHAYYFLSMSRPEVPHVLREAMNRAFGEAVGDLVGLASRHPAYLKHAGLAEPSGAAGPMNHLLAEALDSDVVFLPFSGGTMTHFEYELYEKNLPAGEFNRRWWELAAKYQKIAPPGPRGEEYCDACTKSHIIVDPAQYYDYAIATLIKYQLHDHIARRILKCDPRDCNYAGNAEAGRWLSEILALGATRDWREVLKEKTGEDLSSRAMLEYFQPLLEHLKKVNSSGQ